MLQAHDDFLCVLLRNWTSMTYRIGKNYVYMRQGDSEKNSPGPLRCCNTHIVLSRFAALATADAPARGFPRRETVSIRGTDDGSQPRPDSDDSPGVPRVYVTVRLLLRQTAAKILAPLSCRTYHRRPCEWRTPLLAGFPSRECSCLNTQTGPRLQNPPPDPGFLPAWKT